MNAERLSVTKRTTKQRLFFFSFLLCILFIAGCANKIAIENPGISATPTAAAAETSTPTVTPTHGAIIPTATPTPTSGTLIPTATPTPASGTLIPTATPTSAMVIPTATNTPAGTVVPTPTKAPDKTPTAAPTAEPTKAAKKVSSGHPSLCGALSVTGTQLTDKNGNAVQLRGVSTHGIAWFPEYVNKPLFKELSEQWGANVVRLAMYTDEYGGYCSGGDKEKLRKLVKDGVSYATEADLYVLIDWHVLNDKDPNVHISDAKDFFREMSEEYAGHDNVLYEICNEPNGGTSWQSIKKYALEIIPIIKKNDPDAVIIVGTPNWSQYVDQAAKDPIEGYTNIMYALHFYAATHKDDLRKKMTSAVDAGLPIFVTEYGICDASGNGALDIASANKWVEAMDSKGISYICWNLSNKDESSALIKSSCIVKHSFSLENLSEEGRWLIDVLGGLPGISVGNSGNGKDPGQDNTNKGNGNYNGNTDNNSSKEPIDSPLTTEGTSGNIKYILSISNTWESEGKTFYQYDLTVKNTGNAEVSGWSLSIPAMGKIAVSNIWCAKASVSGNILNITCEEFNKVIPANAEISGIGFIISVE